MANAGAGTLWHVVCHDTNCGSSLRQLLDSCSLQPNLSRASTLNFINEDTEQRTGGLHYVSSPSAFLHRCPPFPSKYYECNVRGYAVIPAVDILFRRCCHAVSHQY